MNCVVIVFHLSRVFHPWQIEKDLLRTMPTNACFSSLASVGVPRLKRVLRGLAWLYPDIGYCQGTGMVRMNPPCDFCRSIYSFPFRSSWSALVLFHFILIYVFSCLFFFFLLFLLSDNLSVFTHYSFHFVNILNLLSHLRPSQRSKLMLFQSTTNLLSASRFSRQTTSRS